MWGLDMIGPIEPKPSNVHRFILVAIDYFTKWVEAASYANVTKSVVIKFIKRHIICRYGLPAHIIMDNGTNLNNKMMTELCEKSKIKHHNSTPYHPKINGAVEAANKNIKKIVQKMVVTYRNWHDMLPYTLHRYWTSVRTSTGATPYSLVYGMEAVLPIEVEIPSLRVLVEDEIDSSKWVQSLLDQLNLIDEKCLAIICHGQLYQRRIESIFNRRIRPRVFQEGDLVLKKRLPHDKDQGALVLADSEGQELKYPVNADAVKRFYP
ncbi:Pol polyprotein, partial [Mucuna pruriens]